MSVGAAASAVGATADEASSRRARRSPEYRRRRAERTAQRELAWLLVEHRMSSGLTQEQLADVIGTSRLELARIESGRHPSLAATAREITDALARANRP